MKTHKILYMIVVWFGWAHTGWAQNLAVISYKNSQGPVEISITLKEFTNTYKTVKQLAPTNTPAVRAFWQDYLRYRLGLEEAYNNKELIKNPSIRHMFADPLLRETFEQNLYKMLAKKKLKGRIAVLDRQAKKLSPKALKRLYKRNPEYNFNFILITTPINPTPGNVKEAQARANKIYQEVKRSKKPFHELVDIYSDDRMNGKMIVPRSRNSIYPSIYRQMKKMKNGQISPPVRAPNGFYIVRLNTRIPFKQANRTQIKASYFDMERGKIFKKYFNGLKSKYKVKVNRSLLKTIRI